MEWSKFNELLKISKLDKLDSPKLKTYKKTVMGYFKVSSSKLIECSYKLKYNGSFQLQKPYTYEMKWTHPNSKNCKRI